MPAATTDPRTTHIVTENINAYMRDIKQYPRIDNKREAELAYIIHNGTQAEQDAAVEELVCSNLRLVVKIAHDFKAFGVTFADLVAEGNCGLMTAARKFEPSKGSRFSCYAAWWIKQNMRLAVASQTRTVRVPCGAAQKALKTKKLIQAFINEHGREPSSEELCELLGCNERTLQTIKDASLQMYSIDEAVQDGDSTTFEEMLADTPEVKNTYREEQIAALRALLPNLTDRERLIVTYTFGVDGKTKPDNIICQETGLPMTEMMRRRICVLSKLRAWLTDLAA